MALTDRHTDRQTNTQMDNHSYHTHRRQEGQKKQVYLWFFRGLMKFATEVPALYTQPYATIRVDRSVDKKMVASYIDTHTDRQNTLIVSGARDVGE